MSALAVLMLAVSELLPNLAQPRKTFDPDKLARMTVSVAARGILQPIRVRRNGRGCWEIVTGECRWRAAQQAGLELVPCLPLEGELDEAEVLIDQISENEIRNSLRPLELARALAKLKALKRCNSQTLAKELGLSAAAITRAEALLTLPADIQEMVDDGRVPESAAYELSRLPDEEGQRGLATLVASKKLNRDQVADTVRDRVGKKDVTPKGRRLSCKIDGGVSVTVTKAGQSLSKADLQSVIGRLREEMKRVGHGDDPADLAQAS